MKQRKNSITPEHILKFYDNYVSSQYWKLVRDLVRHRDKHQCVQCSGKEKLVVHHKTYTNFTNEYNNLDDLVLLCKDCHKKSHSTKESLENIIFRNELIDKLILKNAQENIDFKQLMLNKYYEIISTLLTP